MSAAGPSQGAHCARPLWRAERSGGLRRRPGRRFDFASIPAREHARGPSPRGEHRLPGGSAAALPASVGAVQ